MYRFTFLIVLAAILVATTAADAATGKKKSGIKSDRSTVTAAKQKSQRGSQPPAHSRQGWPTSWSDGSFRYGD